MASLLESTYEDDGEEIVPSRLKNVYRAVRDAAGQQLLVDSFLPPDANMYALVPCLPGAARALRGQKSKHRGKRKDRKTPHATIFPAPALSADDMAERLQTYLQEQVTRESDNGTPQEILLEMKDATPEITVTASDIEHVALQDGAFADIDTDSAYRTHCIGVLNVRLIRPDELFAWALECTDFWARSTLQRHILQTENVYVSEDDLRNAASQSPCDDYAAQAFFNAEAIRGTWLISSLNLNLREARKCERDGPYYKWEVRSDDQSDEHSAVLPWDGVVSGADFAYRLQYAFTSKQLTPALQYDGTPTSDLQYVHFPPREPDEALVARLSRGEWGFLEKSWGMRVVHVDVYAWVLEPTVPSGQLNILPEVAATIPDPSDRFTAAEMAADMAQYFHVDVDADDVNEAVELGAPRKTAVRKAWDKLAASLIAAGGTLAVHRL